MGKIILKNTIIHFEELKNTLPTSWNNDTTQALNFCHEWLNGKESFTLQTSGSTGVPKNIELSRTQMQASAEATVQYFDLQKGDTVLVCLNTSFIGGMMMLVRALVADMDIVLLTPNANPYQEVSTNLPIQFASFVPLQIQSILESRDDQAITWLNSMKAILIGGASVNNTLEQNIQHLKVAVFSSYGMTETVSHIALRRINGTTKTETYSCLPSIEIGKDDRSCLKIRGLVTNNLWIQTNDIVKMVSKNHFIWLGRYDTVINSAGVKLFPEKMERNIESYMESLGIKSFFMAGLPHPIFGEAVTLFIEGKDLGIDSRKVLIPFLQKYELPKAVVYVEVFPTTSSGKLDKRTLLEKYENHYRV